jgi:hypothetical protein
VRLIEDQPALFLSGTAAEMRAHVSSAVTRLREGLQGASVTAVVMSEPTLLYLDLEHGAWALYSHIAPQRYQLLSVPKAHLL